MSMKKKNKRTLSLSKESLRALVNGELSLVRAGGADSVDYTCITTQTTSAAAAHCDEDE